MPTPTSRYAGCGGRTGRGDDPPHALRLPSADTGGDGALPRVPGEARSAERTTAGPPRPYVHVAGAPGLPDAVVQRLTCAGRIRIAVRDRDGTVLDLGRSHRLVSDWLYRALIAEDADVSGNAATPISDETDGRTAYPSGEPMPPAPAPGPVSSLYFLHRVRSR